MLLQMFSYFYIYKRLIVIVTTIPMWWVHCRSLILPTLSRTILSNNHYQHIRILSITHFEKKKKIFFFFFFLLPGTPGSRRRVRLSDPGTPGSRTTRVNILMTSFDVYESV